MCPSDAGPDFLDVSKILNSASLLELPLPAVPPAVMAHSIHELFLTPVHSRSSIMNHDPLLQELTALVSCSCPTSLTSETET